MRQYGEGFKQLIDPMTGRAIPNSPLVASIPTGNFKYGTVYMPQLNTPPAPRDDRPQAQNTDS